MFPATLNEPLLTLPVPAPSGDETGWWALLRSFQRNVLQAFPRQCWDEPVISLPFLGRTLFLVNAPHEIGEFLVGRSADFSRLPAGRRVMSPMVGRGIVVSEGEPWRRQRRALAPAFAPRSIPALASHVVQAVETALDRLGAKAATGTVDLYAEMGRLSLEVAAAAMFSLPNMQLSNELRQLVLAYGSGIGRGRVSDFVLPVWAPTLVHGRRALFRRRWMRVINGFIAERQRLQSVGQPRDLFDLLCETCVDAPPGEMADQVATMIAAGHETTATTLFWGLYLLSQAPGLQADVAAEARAAAVSPDSAADCLPKLRLAEAVVKEALRLYPPAFVIARKAARETRIAGTIVPKGSMVLAPIWMLHRNPRFWEHPEAFDPHRFLDGKGPDRFGYLPFGAGPHVCIGAGLAMAEATLALAAVLSRFEVTLADERPVLPIATLTLRPAHSPGFVLRNRGKP